MSVYCKVKDVRISRFNSLQRASGRFNLTCLINDEFLNDLSTMRVDKTIRQQKMVEPSGSAQRPLISHFLIKSSPGIMPPAGPSLHTRAAPRRSQIFVLPQTSIYLSSPHFALTPFTAFSPVPQLVVEQRGKKVTNTAPRIVFFK